MAESNLVDVERSSSSERLKVRFSEPVPEPRDHSVSIGENRSKVTSWFNENYLASSHVSSRHRSYSCPITKEDILGAENEFSVGVVKQSERVELGERESSSEGGGGDDPKGHPPLDYESLLVCATLVKDAKHGRHSEFALNEASARQYLMYHHWALKKFLYFFLLLNLVLAVFEKPAVENFELPYWVTMILEVACLLFYLFRFIHACSFIKSIVFWSDKKNLILLGAIVLTFIDMIQYVVVVQAFPGTLAIRFSRVLRPLFVINIHEGRQIRRALGNIRKTLPDIINVLILFFLTVGLFALMALKLYSKYNLKFANGQPYFQNYWDAYFDLYILVTTANDPDVMMPAYDHLRWNALFFVAFIIIALYIFMSIILAVIYNNYRKHLKNEVIKAVLNKRKILSTAFEILKVKEDGQYILPIQRFNDLINEIPPNRSKTMNHVLWFVLDSDGDYKIGKSDFLRLADLLNVNVSEVKDRKIFIEVHFPKLFDCKVSKFVRKIVKHQFFRYFFDLLIVINAILIGIDKNNAEWFFLVFFSLEIILKMYTFGIVEFFARLWNRFDFVVIGAAVIASIVEECIVESDAKETSTLDIILVLRVLRLVKIVGGIERFKVVIVTIGNLGPSILTYGSILLVFYYSFAMIGMELFQGKIQYHGYKGTNKSLEFCGNIKLKGTDFYKDHYCSNNFNSVTNAFVLLFELTIVNQWNVLTSGFVFVTSKVARLYFFLFHLICVIIILNIFTAFVLEAFIIEYSFSKGKLESAIETKIHELGLGLGSIHKKKKSRSKKNDKKGLLENVEEIEEHDPRLDSDHDPNLPQGNDESADTTDGPGNIVLPDLSMDTDIRFHLKKGRKNVESMLQRMFENEIEEEGIGSDFDMVDIEHRVDRRLSTVN